MPTARRRGLTWTSRGASANPSACRWWPAAAPGSGSTWRTLRWPRHLPGYELLRTIEIQRGRSDSRHHPGTENGPRADDGLDEPGVSGKNDRNRPDPFLEPLAPEILDERRDERAPPARHGHRI